MFETVLITNDQMMKILVTDILNKVLIKDKLDRDYTKNNEAENTPRKSQLKGGKKEGKMNSK